MIVVANSSPLILLSGINSLDLLQSLFGTLNIPEAVYEEVVIVGAGRTGSADVAAATWIQQHTVIDTNAVNQIITATKLEPGESETLILAQELNADLAIIDEQPARLYAQTHHIPIIGTLGILLLAKSKSLITEVRPSLDQLVAFGMRLDKSLYQDVLNRAGEQQQ
jgi:hypothetical protein